MKKRIYIALFLYILGLVNIIDWYIFWHQNETLAQQDFKSLKIKYIERFPDLFKPLFESNPEPAAIIFVIILVIAGIIFMLEKKTFYTILGISSFLFAFQNLFSIM